MKPFLILQLRPETDAADGEFASILARAHLPEHRARRIRLDQECLPDDLELDDYAGVIVGGGPGCVSDPPEEKSPLDARIEAQIMGLMPRITATDHPFMGCCYGLGILAAHLGGDVSRARYSEPVGPSECIPTTAAADDPLMRGLPGRWAAFVGHKEAVQALPPGCVHLVSSAPCPFQMIRHGRNVYATQFHPEADARDFENRIRIYKNHGYFPPEMAEALIDICHAADVTVPGEILRRFAARYG
ncbi:glutamine amidotransferase [Pukyongiella litopenaei]|uniref:Glutamine amidotransferase n=1 Tax=Pukyongiella litopenaei TaxID=2605946 RepID=A0A2S0MKW1_9RHOB|nr:glutamine amidotransferase [Pukyongiella litopenaei]AVO36520.1 glutamine amidotransferase [Pukyongiella litopenaei]